MVGDGGAVLWGEKRRFTCGGAFGLSIGALKESTATACVAPTLIATWGHEERRTVVAVDGFQVITMFSLVDHELEDRSIGIFKGQPQEIGLGLGNPVVEVARP